MQAISCLGIRDNIFLVQSKEDFHVALNEYKNKPKDLSDVRQPVSYPVLVVFSHNIHGNGETEVSPTFIYEDEINLLAMMNELFRGLKNDETPLPRTLHTVARALSDEDSTGLLFSRSILNG